MHVLIDARIEPGINGGIEQAIVGLARAYSENHFENLIVSWLVYSENIEWLLLEIPDTHHIFTCSLPVRSVKQKFRSLRRFMFMDYLISSIRSRGPLQYRLPNEPEIVKEIAPDVIHFPTQFGFRTEIPNIYQPHDLQHLVFPENFSKEVLAIRKIGYESMMAQSSVIVVGNQWTLRDFSEKFPAQAQKLMNVPVYPRLLEGNKKPAVLLDLPEKYVFYPASAWPHKNHCKLIQALALMRDDGLEIDLVLTGTKLSTSSNIVAEIRKYALQDSVHILGYLDDNALRECYQKATLVAIPTLFESESLPMWEAFSMGIPVASSNVTTLPEQGKDAALFFDPTNAQNIANVLIEIISSAELRENLSLAGKKRLSSMKSFDTAVGYCFAYQKATQNFLPYNLKNKYEKSFKF